MTAPSTTASRWYNSALIRILVLTLTFTTAAAYELLHLNALTDSDIWLHLSTGQWILQNHAVPRSAIFSQFASLPWVDSSWGFDILTALCTRIWGLPGLPVLLMLLQVAIAIAIFTLAGGRRNFWPAVILSALAQFSISPVSPRPAMCSLVLLACELTLLLKVKRTADVRWLFWLPLVFAIWVNLDRQFSYGLVALGLFWIAVVIEQQCRQGITWFETGLPDISVATMSAAVGASLLATILSPYGYRSYLPVWLSATNSASDRFFPELHSLRFRRPQDYLLMLLVMTAFFALGRRRSRDLFLISLLALSAAVSFRFQRENWLALIAAVAIIGNAIPVATTAAAAAAQKLRVQKLATAALVFLVLVVLVLRLPGKNDGHSDNMLLLKIAKTFPVSAADYIRQNHLPQPLFNSYAFGGFLTWALPEYPVLIDGRTDLYGDAINLPYFQATTAAIPLQSYPGFTQAQTILLEANSPMAQALSTLPGFRVAYKDDVAVVLVRTQY
ncbi:MAG: hypothetical protein WCC25_00260 [Candidatus Korobacteraceae bacterium]